MPWALQSSELPQTCIPGQAVDSTGSGWFIVVQYIPNPL